MRILIPEDISSTKCRHEGSPPHKHVLWEIVFFIEGDCYHHIQGKTFRCNHGDVYIVGPHHAHNIELIDDHHCHRDLYFTDEQFKNICATYNIPNFYEHLCHNIISLHLSGSMLKNMLEQLKTIEIYDILRRTAPSQKSNEDFSTCLSVCNSILHFILGTYALQDLKQSQHNIPEWLLNLLLDLNDPNFFNQKPSEIIKQSGYSHSRFSELFKGYIGVSLVEYMINQRLNHAADLLVTTNKSTLEISSIIGYDSYSCFVRLFKKQFSLSPIQYRQANLKHI